jgi:carboxypeptidase family protein
MRLIRIVALVALCLSFTPGPASAVTGFDSFFSGESAFITIDPGETRSFQVFFRNTGTVTWARGGDTQVDLAVCLEDKVTCNAQDQGEATWNSGWISPTRYTTAKQTIVLPGSIATFTYDIKAPLNATGTHRFNGDLVVAKTGERIHPEGYYQDAKVEAVGSVVVPTPTPTPAPPVVVLPTPTPMPTPTPTPVQFSISGKVTDRATGLAIANIDVQAFDALAPCCSDPLASTTTDAQGNYTLVLTSGATVTVTFKSPDTGPAYVQRWWDDTADSRDADPIVVAGQIVNINEPLDQGYRISGRVTDSADPDVGVSGISVGAQPNFDCCFYFTTTDGTGHYSFVVNAATYRISFFPPLGSDFLEQWWNEKPGFNSADLLTVPSATVDLSSINASLVHGIAVTGTVTDAVSGDPIDRVGVVATLDDPAVACCVNYHAQTDADGNYTLYVRAGDYRINFQPPNTTDYVIEFWDDKPNRDSADVLTVTEPTSGIDAGLEKGFRISGRVTDAATDDPLSGSVVTINPLGCCQAFTLAVTGSDGTYSVLVRAGSYKIGFNPPFGTDFVPEYWDDKPDVASADTLVVDGPKPDIDGALEHGVQLSGAVTDASDASTGVAGVNVSALTAGGSQAAFAATQADGTYSIFVRPGTYFLSFGPPFGTDFVHEYWDDKPDLGSADPIVVTGPLEDLDAELSHAGP